jgi:hypothetical protein
MNSITGYAVLHSGNLLKLQMQKYMDNDSNDSFWRIPYIFTIDGMLILVASIAGNTQRSQMAESLTPINTVTQAACIE